MGLRIALISRNNGVGLSLDADLLEELFASAGHEVVFYDWKSETMPHADIAFHLELISRNLAQQADRNIALPNLEWYPSEWMKFLPAFDQVWAKSAYAYRFCRQRGARSVHLTGFLGRDRWNPDVKREVKCLHLRGRSHMKGTEQVLEAWRSHPDLPPLTVVSKDPIQAPSHVSVIHDPSDRELDTLMNGAQIHVCPSVAEGWGHYITEGMSVGATVVTTDASPMNEHIRPEWGYLVGVTKTRPHHQAVQTYTSPGLIAEAVQRASALTPEKRTQVGRAARAHFLERNASFREVALRLVEQ
ncbi:glycosyltransferase [Streptomyces sp. NEAU-Y11]|uniref:glycosyltransferase n=1 Tax=Streptomyces cucumeris TaxID=2962890 RepID=UPI0020C8DD27|nr:glycosyltransferase [Streptomyces sp. NEAU-Y11]MCP9209722.1 glycosyltransferase [Streptomyces sp. NEAU-Y11]